MGDVAQFVGKCNRAAESFDRVQREQLAQASQAVAVAWTAEIRAAGLPAGGKLRNVGRSGAPFMVRHRVEGSTAVVGLPAVAHLVIGAGPTKPHIIGPRGLGTRKSNTQRASGALLMRTLVPGTTSVAGAFAKGKGQRRRKGAKALSFPSGDARAYAAHPGSKRRDLWPGLVETAQTVSVRVYRAALPGALTRSGFGR